MRCKRESGDAKGNRLSPAPFPLCPPSRLIRLLACLLRLYLWTSGGGVGAWNDEFSPAENFAVEQGWQKAGRPVKLHAYQQGHHGFGTGVPGTTTTGMPDQFQGPGKVFDDGTVHVTAVANTHYASADHASYAYRFAMAGEAIVFTGDTGPSPAVTQLAKGADILIAEMASAADREHVPPAIRPHMDKEHLSPGQVGTLAREAGVGMLLLSHVGNVAQGDLDEIARHYHGKVVLGADMMTIPLTKLDVAAKLGSSAEPRR